MVPGESRENRETGSGHCALIPVLPPQLYVVCTLSCHWTCASGKARESVTTSQETCHLNQYQPGRGVRRRGDDDLRPMRIAQAHITRLCRRWQEAALCRVFLSRR